MVSNFNVKIVSCSKATLWYFDKIGDIINVYDSITEQYIMKSNGSFYFIDKSDTILWIRNEKLKRLINE